MSLLSRLRALQQEDPVPLTSLDDLTLDDLMNEKVQFGQKQLGHTHMEAWQDQPWIAYMITHYGKSQTPAHRRLLRFVELMIEHHEKDQVIIPVRPPQESVAGYAGTSGRSGSVFPQSKMKARPSGQTQAISLDDGTEEEFEMYASTTMNQPITENPEFKAIQDRMLNLENALSRVIHHLESKIEEVTQ